MRFWKRKYTNEVRKNMDLKFFQIKNKTGVIFITPTRLGTPQSTLKYFYRSFDTASQTF